MTKTVRIENADNNATKAVICEVWERGYDASPDNHLKGLDPAGKPDTLVLTERLQAPTQMWSATIHDSRYIRIFEVDA